MFISVSILDNYPTEACTEMFILSLPVVAAEFWSPYPVSDAILILFGNAMRSSGCEYSPYKIKLWGRE